MRRYLILVLATAALLALAACAEDKIVEVVKEVEVEVIKEVVVTPTPLAAAGAPRSDGAGRSRR